MTIASETKQTLQRFAIHTELLIVLCHRYEVTGWRAPFLLVRAYRTEVAFRDEWARIWKEVSVMEGGKITLSSALGILGLMLGGVGLAGAWGAVGIPLVVVLLPLGFLAGQELDTSGATRRFFNFFRSEKPVEIASTELLEMKESTAAVLTMLGAHDSRLSEFDNQVAELRAQFEVVKSSVATNAMTLENQVRLLSSRCAELENSLVLANQRFLQLRSSYTKLRLVAAAGAMSGFVSFVWLFLR